MKKKTIVKIMSVALMVAMVAMCLSNVALADTTTMQVIDGKSSTTSGSFQEILKVILGVTQVIGVAIAIIMLVVLAIKYISAAPGDKAEIKKHAVVYIVGAVVLFAASGIIGLISQFATNIKPQGSN